MDLGGASQPPPISQYSLRLQQQQAQNTGGYIPNANVSPYDVPYRNVPAGGAQKKICNPCCCCKRGGCNLRMNCVAIAVFLIIAGISQFYYVAKPLPIRPECEGKGKYQHHRPSDNYERPEPYYDDDRRYRENNGQQLPDMAKCSPLKAILLVLMILSILMAILSIASGIFLLLAVFLPRSWWAALIAGILMSIISLMMLANTILLIYASLGFTYEVDWPKYLDEPDPMHDPKANNEASLIQKAIIFVISGVIVALIFLGVNIWLTVCAFQFSRQIKAGVDKYPAEGPPPQFLPPPTLQPLAASLPVLPPPPQVAVGDPTL